MKRKVKGSACGATRRATTKPVAQMTTKRAGISRSARGAGGNGTVGRSVVEKGPHPTMAAAGPQWRAGHTAALRCGRPAPDLPGDLPAAAGMSTLAGERGEERCRSEGE